MGLSQLQKAGMSRLVARWPLWIIIIPRFRLWVIGGKKLVVLLTDARSEHFETRSVKRARWTVFVSREVMPPDASKCDNWLHASSTFDLSLFIFYFIYISWYYRRGYKKSWIEMMVFFFSVCFYALFWDIKFYWEYSVLN